MSLISQAEGSYEQFKLETFSIKNYRIHGRVEFLEFVSGIRTCLFCSFLCLFLASELVCYLVQFSQLAQGPFTGTLYLLLFFLYCDDNIIANG